MINNKICFYVFCAFFLCAVQSADAVGVWLAGCTTTERCDCGPSMVGSSGKRYCCPRTQTSTTITCPSGWTREKYSGAKIPEAPTQYVCTRADEVEYDASTHSYIKTTYSTCWATSTTTTETRYCPTTTDSCGLNHRCLQSSLPII